MLVRVKDFFISFLNDYRACARGDVDLADKEDDIGAIITEIYGIVAELSISSDKIVQEHGKELRKLLEQLKHKIAARNKTAE
jgi:hypothetical protein